MVFMAHQVRFHIRFFWITCIVFLFFGCLENDSTGLVNADDSNIFRKKGIVYWDKSPFTGQLFKLNEKMDTIEVSTYLNGVKEGISRKYWGNSRPRLSAQYKNGVFHGTVREWYEDGKPYAVFHYEDGYEKGSQKIWKPDGEYKANYQVIGNRKYGLTGSKNCSNEWISE